MELKRLNDTQTKQAEDFLKNYKYVYVCNRCGSIYGTDFLEAKDRLCHICDLKKQKEKKENKK